MSKQRFFILAFAIFVTSVPGTSRGQLFEDDNCRLNSGAVGECRKPQDCRELQKYIASGGRPVICSFNQTNPIVCCPKNATATTLPQINDNATSIMNTLSTGDPCTTKNGSPGECRSLRDCLTANIIASGIAPKLCYFEQSTPIVCCPISVESSSKQELNQSRPNLEEKSKTSQSAVVTTTTTPRAGGRTSVESDPCTMKNGFPGECRSLRDCPSANTIASGIAPKLCFFEQSTPIVCCPISVESSSKQGLNQSRPNLEEKSKTAQSAVATTTTTPRAGGRTSVERCEFYSQFVYQMVVSPILFVIPEWHNDSQCKVDVRKNRPPLTAAGEAINKEFPHVTSLGYGKETNIQWKCAGSLISENFILTAARCINSPNSGPVRWARIGDLKPTIFTPDTRGILKVEGWIKQEGPRPLIALLKLEKYVTFSGDTRPACLYTQKGIPPGYRFATTTGWGMVNWDNSVTTDELNKQDFLFTPRQQCSENKRRRRSQDGPTNHTVQAGVICVKNPAQINTPCVGGLGSPLHIVLETPYCMHSILGVNTSGRRGCPSAERPSAFTRIADLIPWIESHVWA